MIKYHVTKYFVKLKEFKISEATRKAKELADLKKKQAMKNNKSKSTYATSSIKRKSAAPTSPTSPSKPQNTVAKQQTVDLKTSGGAIEIKTRIEAYNNQLTE